MFYAQTLVVLEEDANALISEKGELRFWNKIEMFFDSDDNECYYRFNYNDEIVAFRKAKQTEDLIDIIGGE